MIISEQQIMRLMDFSHAHLAQLCRDNAPLPVIEALIKLLHDIAEQQSNELKVIALEN